MKITTVLAIALGLGALGACNKSSTEQAADNVEANYENTADTMEANVDNAADAMQANTDHVTEDTGYSVNVVIFRVRRSADSWRSEVPS